MAAAAAAVARQQRCQANGVAALTLRAQALRKGGADTDRLARLEGLEAWGRTSLPRVPGFFEPGLLEAYWLLDVAQRARGVRGHVGEIGVYHGRSFVPLALLRRADETALAIDCFEAGQAANRDGSGVGHRARFEANLDAAGVVDGVAVLAADSTALSPAGLLAATALRPGNGIVAGAAEEGTGVGTREHARAPGEGGAAPRGFRLFSIDGSHTEEAVASDLALVDACLAEGGVVLVDDALNPDWPGVAGGLARFVLSGQRSAADAEPLRPFALAYNKCLLARGPWCGVYREALAGLQRKRAVFLGSNTAILPQGFVAAHFANDIPPAQQGGDSGR